SVRVRGSVRVRDLRDPAAVHAVLRAQDQRAQGGLRMSIEVGELLEVRRARKESRARWLVQSPRRGEDPPVKRLAIHVGLIVAALVAVFPVIRVFGTAMRPGNNLLNPTLEIIPR